MIVKRGGIFLKPVKNKVVIDELYDLIFLAPACCSIDGQRIMNGIFGSILGISGGREKQDCQKR